MWCRRLRLDTLPHRLCYYQFVSTAVTTAHSSRLNAHLLDIPRAAHSQKDTSNPHWKLHCLTGDVRGDQPNMDLDSPQTPNFSGLKDFPMGLFKASGPNSRVPIFPMKEDLPYIPEKEEYHDSGVFFSSVDSTPEPREIEADFADISSDSTDGTDSIGPDEGKEVLCSPDLDFDSDPEPLTSRLQSFFSPFKTEKVSLDDLTAGPPILDLTRLMMQPVRKTPPPPSKPQKKSIIPGNLLERVSQMVRGKMASGEEVCTWTSEDEARCEHNKTIDEARCEHNKTIDEARCEHNITIQKGAACVKTEESTEDETNPLLIDLIEEGPSEQTQKKKRKRAKKRKSVSANEDKPSKKEKKTSPNYFVAIKIKNPEVHRHVEEVQKHVASHVPSLSAAFIPLPTLHITLHVSHLEDQDAISRAKSALEECQERIVSEWNEGYPPLLRIIGLGAFRDNVVFAKLEEGPDYKALKRIADSVNESLLNHGVVCTDDRGFKPHITVMKLSKAPHLRYKGIKKIERGLYEAYSKCEFGWQRVLGLQLCSMYKPKDKDGYYHVEHEVTFDIPEGESSDGAAGRTAKFEPKTTVTKPIEAIIQLEKELKWVFHPPQDQA